MRLLIIAVWLAVSIPAQAASSGKGTTAGAFLKLAPGARGAAMGESLAGVADDAYAAWYNPAGLGFLERVEAGAAHEARFAGISYDAAVLAVPVLSWRDSPLRANAYGTTALSVYSLSAGGIERRGLVETDAPSGTFSSSDRAYALSYGLAPDGGDWAIGGTAKLVDSSLDTARATALAFDAGALWKGERASFGAGARNLAGRLRYGSVSDPLPAAFWIGGGWRPRPDVLISASLDAPREDAMGLGIGAERRWTPAPGLRAAVRGGYATARSDGGGAAGFSLGCGVTWRAMEFDFAWSPSSVMGDLFKYSILVRFGEGRPGGISRDKAGWR